MVDKGKGRAVSTPKEDSSPGIDPQKLGRKLMPKQSSSTEPQQLGGNESGIAHQDKKTKSTVPSWGMGQGSSSNSQQILMNFGEEFGPLGSSESPTPDPATVAGPAQSKLPPARWTREILHEVTKAVDRESQNHSIGVVVDYSPVNGKQRPQYTVQPSKQHTYSEKEQEKMRASVRYKWGHFGRYKVLCSNLGTIKSKPKDLKEAYVPIKKIVGIGLSSGTTKMVSMLHNILFEDVVNTVCDYYFGKDKVSNQWAHDMVIVIQDSQRVIRHWDGRYFKFATQPEMEFECTEGMREKQFGMRPEKYGISDPKYPVPYRVKRVKDPQGYLEIDEHTLVVAPNRESPVRQLLGDVITEDKLPAGIICFPIDDNGPSNNVENLNRYPKRPLQDPYSERLDELVKQGGYDCLPWHTEPKAQDYSPDERGLYIWGLNMYLKKRTP